MACAGHDGPGGRAASREGGGASQGRSAESAELGGADREVPIAGGAGDRTRRLRRGDLPGSRERGLAQGCAVVMTHPGTFVCGEAHSASGCGIMELQVGAATISSRKSKMRHRSGRLARRRDTSSAGGRSEDLHTFRQYMAGMNGELMPGIVNIGRGTCFRRGMAVTADSEEIQ